MSQGRFRTFVTGALIGAGLGILLAPKEGSETRSDLKKSFNTLIDTIKDVDIEETKAIFLRKVTEIKNELSTIDEDTAKEIAKEKIAIVEEKCDELIEDAKEYAAPIVEKAATEVKKNVTETLKEVVTELESSETEKSTKTVQKKNGKKKSSSNKKSAKKS